MPVKCWTFNAGASGIRDANGSGRVGHG